MKKYGRIAVVTHITYSIMSFSGIYFAIKNGVDLKKYLVKVGVDTDSVMKVGASTFTVAYILYKATMPIRLQITFLTVPILAKILKRK